MPIDPGPCAWKFPDPLLAEPDQEVIAIGADLAPATLLEGYRRGVFPMYLASGELAWWSPNPRGILALEDLKISKSLRKSVAQFDVTFDTAFEAVMRGCDEDRIDSWINEDFIQAYTHLHSLGWAHSVEVWREGALVGGLYGLEVGGLFAGESMFHRERDASKVAMVALVRRLQRCGGARLLDVQWRTDHLATLGVTEIPREEYLTRLRDARRQAACLEALNRTT
ncbi:MAG: leucyl/phenylalanyl-tRNA--protein transferase [Actinomycetota bacterium]|nr:leucyl/phenylalanyl-tRNA--protein transferase [Actinomycetota bacterium]